MERRGKEIITVHAIINAPLKKVWKYWTTPEDIVKWNNASDDWHTPRAKNDLRTGGHFDFRMEAKDGSTGFDFEGDYGKVTPFREILYTIGDGRKVEITFFSSGNKTEVIESFEVENTNPIEMQRIGWQSILDNFKKYTEAN